MRKIYITTIIIVLNIIACSTGTRNFSTPETTIPDASYNVTDGEAKADSKTSDSSNTEKDSSSEAATNPVSDAGSDSNILNKEAGTGSDAFTETDADVDSSTVETDSGNDAETDSGSDSGSDSGTVPECISGSKCEGLKAFTRTDGFWVEETTCPYVCNNGTCMGECIPNTHQCSGLNAQTCNSSGQWVTNQICPFICGGAGVCSGSCVPTSKQCSGTTPQTCDSNGAWVNGSACDHVCSSGNCIGVCTPGNHRCSGLDSQTCNNSGQWVTDQTCPFVCSGAGTCSGVCVPTSKDCQGNTPRTCDSTGAWISGSTCTYVCSAGNCTGVCHPGTTQCSGQQIQICNGSGQWGTASNCPAVSGATSYCSAGSCTFDCNLDYDDCDSNPTNGCEVNLNTDGANCGSCEHSCCGGACSGAVCGVYTSGLYPSSTSSNAGTYDVSQTDIYWTTGSNLNKRARNGGSTTTLISGKTDVRAITVHGLNIFWSDTANSVSEGILSMDTQGNIHNYTYNPPANYLLITSTDILYAGGNRSSIDYTQLLDNHTDLVMNGNNNPVVNAYAEPIVTDGTYVYAARDMYSSNQRPIVRAPVHGTTETVFVSYSPTNPTAAYSFAHLATDETNLYYVLYIGAEVAKTGIWKKPFAGGTATQLVSSTGAHAVSTDGTNLYYADQFPNRILKVGIDGGTPTTLYTSSGGIASDSVKVINQCIYFLGNNGLQAIAVNP